MFNGLWLKGAVLVTIVIKVDTRDGEKPTFEFFYSYDELASELRRTATAGYIKEVLSKMKDRDVFTIRNGGTEETYTIVR
jgi:hypothetical protein